MGISLQAYRCAIGMFNGAKYVVLQITSCVYAMTVGILALFFIFIVLQMLLLSGDIEVNPGPDEQNWSDISICHLNARSLPDKLSAIKNNLACTYDIIAVTETLLRPYHTQDLSINNFHQVIRLDRQDRGGGGCAVYVKNTLLYERLSHIELPSVESIWLKIRSENNTFILCVCYRPPDAPLTFWDSFQEQIDLVKHLCNNILITGDLNSDPNSETGPYLQQFADQNHLQIHVEEPTRITPTSATILDQFLSNMPHILYDIAVQPPISTNDHCTISTKLKFCTVKKPAYHRTVWYYNRANFEDFRNGLKSCNWEPCFDSNNIDTVCQRWTDKFLSIARNFIPNKIVTIRPSDSPWYDNRLRRLKRKLDKIHNKAKKSNNDPNIWSNYREVRNEYNRQIKNAEQDYNIKLASNLQKSKVISPKRWWNLAKTFLGQNNDSSYPPITENDVVHFDPGRKAQAFNNFFLSHSTINSDHVTLPELEYLTDKELAQIEFDDREVLDLLKCIDTSKATGPDGISPKMLKEAANIIYPQLARIIRLSLSSCKVPRDWKKAHVMPLHKKSSKDKIDNYRPISLLSCPSKILERIVFKYVFNYFRENFLISVFQSGFIPGDSTVNQLVNVYHILCNALDKKKDVRIVFCDISKAFDKVWHDGIIFKLESMGVKGPLLCWFRDYLTNRYQRVVIEGKESSWGMIKAGVPQGSVLGPLLFLVYINDITSVVQSNIRLFADDTTIFVEIEDPDIAAEVLNKDLNAISCWAKQWIVTFSPPKTESMLITLKKSDNVHPPLFLDNTEIKEVSEHKHLGVTLSSSLKWDAHIATITSKAGKRLDVLSHLMYKLDRNTLNTMYMSFILPVMEYCDVIMCNLSERQVYNLEMIHKRAGRIVSGATRGTSKEIIYRELGWESLDKRRERHCVLYFHKIVHDQTPAFLSNLLPGYVSDRTHYNLRNVTDINTMPSRIDVLYKSFIPHASRLWNNLQPDLKNMHEYQEFKVNYNKNAPSPNNYYSLGSRKAGIHHARIRLKCSALNEHLFVNHVSDSPVCSCGHDTEDSVHYFFVCPNYHTQRATLHDKIIPLAPFNLNTLLNGTEEQPQIVNETIADAVHEYITNTSRFF